MNSITEVTQGGKGGGYNIPMVSFASLVHDYDMAYNVFLLLSPLFILLLDTLW